MENLNLNTAILEAAKKLPTDKGMKLKDFTEVVKENIGESMRNKVNPNLVSIMINALRMEEVAGGNKPTMTIAKGNDGGVWLGYGPTRLPLTTNKQIAANLAGKGEKAVKDHLEAMVQKCVLAARSLGKTHEEVLENFLDTVRDSVEKAIIEFDSDPFEPTKQEPKKTSK